VDAAYRSESLRIWQSGIEQNDVNLALAKMLLGCAHAIHVRQRGVIRAVLAKHLAEQTDISGIILDQENFFDQSLPLGVRLRKVRYFVVELDSRSTNG
jgi:hypothetical protein